MNDHSIAAIVSVSTALIGVAAIAVLVSGNSATGTVFGAFGSSLSRMICQATAPVTRKSCAAVSTPTVSIPTSTTPTSTGSQESVNSTIQYGGVATPSSGAYDPNYGMME